MQLQCLILNKTPLYAAIEKNNIDIVRLLLTNEKLDINIYNISNKIVFSKFYFVTSIKFEINKFI